MKFKGQAGGREQLLMVEELGPGMFQAFAEGSWWNWKPVSGREMKRLLMQFGYYPCGSTSWDMFDAAVKKAALTEPFFDTYENLYAYLRTIPFLWQRSLIEDLQRLVEHAEQNVGVENGNSTGPV